MQSRRGTAVTSAWRSASDRGRTAEYSLRMRRTAPDEDGFEAGAGLRHGALAPLRDQVGDVEHEVVPMRRVDLEQRGDLPARCHEDGPSAGAAMHNAHRQLLIVAEGQETPPRRHQMSAAIVGQGEAGQRATHLGCAIKDSFTLLGMF